MEIGSYVNYMVDNEVTRFVLFHIHLHVLYPDNVHVHVHVYIHCTVHVYTVHVHEVTYFKV